LGGFSPKTKKEIQAETKAKLLGWDEIEANSRSDKDNVDRCLLMEIDEGLIRNELTAQ